MHDPTATLNFELPDTPTVPPTNTLKLGRVIGQGAMGQVLAAWQPALARSIPTSCPFTTSGRVRGARGWS